MPKQHTSGQVLMGSVNEVLSRMGHVAAEAATLTEPGMAVQFTLSSHNGPKGLPLCGAVLLAGTPEQNERVLAAVAAVEREMMLEAGQGFTHHDFDTRRKGWKRTDIGPGAKPDVEQ